jgi:hypothetical protein
MATAGVASDLPERELGCRPNSLATMDSWTWLRHAGLVPSAVRGTGGA